MGGEGKRNATLLQHYCIFPSEREDEPVREAKFQIVEFPEALISLTKQILSDVYLWLTAVPLPP